MAVNDYRIGFSDSGGVFIGRNIRSGYHHHHLLAFILSAEQTFRVQVEDGSGYCCEAAFIGLDVPYRLITSAAEPVVCLHIDPYSEQGLKVNRSTAPVLPLQRNLFRPLLERLETWPESGTVPVDQTEEFIGLATAELASRVSGKIPDERILRGIRLIRDSGPDAFTVEQIADRVHLSPSRFSHLFRRETGITFSRYLQTRKLVESLRSMHGHSSLTEASFDGGFADQPHFTKVFRKTFGIRPSGSKKADPR